MKVKSVLTIEPARHRLLHRLSRQKDTHEMDTSTRRPQPSGTHHPGHRSPGHRILDRILKQRPIMSKRRHFPALSGEPRDVRYRRVTSSLRHLLLSPRTFQSVLGYGARSLAYESRPVDPGCEYGICPQRQEFVAGAFHSVGARRIFGRGGGGAREED